MQAYAADVVLLPPNQVTEWAICLNKEISPTGGNAIALNNENCLPHISLAMGRLENRRLQSAIDCLHDLAKKYSAFELRAARVEARIPGSIDTVVSVEFDRNSLLMNLHLDIVRTFSRLFSGQATEDDMFDPPPIEPSALDWINDFIPDHSFDNFWPHITLGIGAAPRNFDPFTFLVSRLAICHLGNRCTCRKILAEVEFEQQEA